MRWGQIIDGIMGGIPCKMSKRHRKGFTEFEGLDLSWKGKYPPKM
jgi:hypothetical protein